jgi:S-sulfo-L-cysteine synthase (3-phospho-L-serine-dependent)
MSFYMIETQLTELGFRPLLIARELGFEPVLVSNDPDRYAGLHSYRELLKDGCRVILADTNDTASVIRAVEEDGRPVEAVFTICDYNLVITAHACRHFALPSLTPEAAAAATNKLSCRQLLSAHGIAVPSFANAVLPAELEMAIQSVGLPCVVKPMTDSASVGVRLCRSADEVRLHHESLVGERRNARGQQRPLGVLVEQYILGYEVSVETVYQPDAGRHFVLGVTDKQIGASPAFVETGEQFPSLLPDDIVRRAGSLACDALAAIGHDFGAAHTEIRIGAEGPAIIEINARVGGDDISELVRLATGVDILRVVVELACGREVDPRPRSEPTGAAFRALLPPRPGIVRHIEGLDLASRFPGVLEARIHVPCGARVGHPVSNHEIIGHVLTAAPTAAEAGRMADAAAAQIVIDVEAEG